MRNPSPTLGRQGRTRNPKRGEADSLSGRSRGRRSIESLLDQVADVLALARKSSLPAISLVPPDQPAGNDTGHNPDSRLPCLVLDMARLRQDMDTPLRRGFFLRGREAASGCVRAVFEMSKTVFKRLKGW